MERELEPSASHHPHTNTSSPSPAPSPRGRNVRQDPNNSNTEAEEETCGICLLESSRAIRGKIDRCMHYFCFVCIMEWAKTETRCPLCKQRFRSVRRPVVPGLFSAERVVKIPERDQVYHPLGVESTSINETHLDPHCTVCKSSANEAYLASCALCDSTFHTSCVGLGTVIPEAELHCSDCQTCMEEYSKSQLDHDDESRYADQETKEKIRKIRREDHSISIEDIVGDIRGQDTTNAPSNTHSSGSGPSRPLTDRELREQRIHAFSDNWRGLRLGSVSFEDVARPYRRTESMTQNNPVAATSSPGRENQKRKSRDVKKAWEMMDKAILHLPKKSPEQNVQANSQPLTIVRNPEPTVNRHPPVIKPRTHCESASAPHFNHQVPQPRRGLGQYSSNGHAPSVQRQNVQAAPLGASSQVPDLREASYAIEKREHVRLENAKTEIKSLVKSNLSGIPKDTKRKLGTNGYKEVARISTHSILAACGLEHNQDLARHPPSYRPFCNHNINMSKSLPGICYDCFNEFVRRIVESILQEKI